MGPRQPLKPRPLKRQHDEHRARTHHAIQLATFNHLTELVADPDHPGQRIAYADLEERMRARAYRQNQH